MKRFWKDAAVAEAEGGFGVALDGKPLKTPERAALIVPTHSLADAIAAEWNASAETIDPRAMPMTGLANAATDRAGEEIAAGLARFGESDLTCYRAADPAPLVDQQTEAWDALLNWARRRFDVDFTTCSGIIHVPQPPETIRRLAHAVHALDPFRLAALSPLVTISGSLVAGLAVVEQAMPVGKVWDAVTIDEQWQLEQWGSDAEAEAMLEARRIEFLAASRFAELLS